MLKLTRFFLLRMFIGVCLALPVSATVVRLDIEFGDQPAGFIFIELFDVDAPAGIKPAQATVDNFLRYIDDGAGTRRYDGTFLHRKIPGFIVQGGGFAYDPSLGAFGLESAPHIPTDATINNEFDGLTRSNLRGTIAMAKQDGLADSATSEWFINLGDNSADLDNQNGGFTVFGRVLGDGMVLVDAIAALAEVNSGGAFSNLPVVDAAAPVTIANLVNLAGVVVDPPATISPDLVDVDFGPVEIAVNAAAVTRTVTIQNMGVPGQDLVIGAISEADIVAPFSFSAAGDNCSDQTLAFEQSCTIKLEFLPTAAGDFQDGFAIPSNDASQSSLVITLRGTGSSAIPVLDVTPATLDFEAVGTGQPQELTLTVSNLGGGQLQPLAPSVSGTDSSAFSISANTCSAALLDIGQTCTLTVRLISFSLGSLTAVLDMPADPGGQVVQVSLAANITLLEPDIQLPDSVSVEDTFFEASGTTSLSISSIGADDLYVSAIEVQGVDAALFSVTTTDCIDVALIPQSGPCAEEISFSPDVAGEFSAILRVRSNDPDDPVIDVPITATASQDDDGVTDSIEQAGPNNGDGNQDGIPDAQQAEVTSLLSVSGDYVTLESLTGTLFNVRAIESDLLRDVPTFEGGSLEFVQGFFLFAVRNVPAEADGRGGKVAVTLTLPAGQQALNRYFMFGRLPNELPPALFREHWYLFPSSRGAQIGAEFFDNKVTLRLVDGGGGDSDQATDGRVVSVGGPAVLTVDSSLTDSGGGGGCSMRTKMSPGTHRPGLDLLILLVGLLVMRVFVWRTAVSRR